ncbi:DUF4292 domain-containing protein [Capnocytophaga catalasegens]|uniref:DUF4292 domain-containing protein n=1 Tax=Capnocytophaga catalasegens TaxID=1004260 RepID=UPI00222F79C8|nr:DUF4292 domain-containing protein [Capnocytophaga catalasegens]
MKRFFIYSCLLILLIGCKTKKVVLTTNQIDFSLKTKEITQLHKESCPVFNTLSGTFLVSFDNGKDQQSFPLTFRIKSGETIWLSAPFGLAKVIITPQQVQFYNKTENTYFDGDYSFIKHFLNLSLDYQSVENMLIGQIFTNETNNCVPSNEGYVCQGQENITKTNFLLNPSFRVKEVSASQAVNQRYFTAKYSYQSVENQFFPYEIYIETRSEESQAKINIRFNSIELNQPLGFPYKVPSGYKRLTFDN